MDEMPDETGPPTEQSQPTPIVIVTLPVELQNEESNEPAPIVTQPQPRMVTPEEETQESPIEGTYKPAPIMTQPQTRRVIIEEETLESPNELTYKPAPIVRQLQPRRIITEEETQEIMPIPVPTPYQFTFMQASIGSYEPSAPDSLISAPPSYSFVMRQVAARQRPRLMGTFVSSPSYVRHAPPPTYATAFDLHVDPPPPPVIPPPPSNYGFHPIPVLCPECGNLVLTTLRTKVTMCTHLCALLLCVALCWICVPIPYMLRSFKKVYHNCPICRSYLGMYSPTSSGI